MRNSRIRATCLGAVIAALYTALTLVFQPISFGALQLRISEAFTLLPVLFPEAVPGLAVGCLLSNLLAGANPYDVVFGTLATLLAALLTRRLRKNVWLAALPPVVCNGVIIGLVLTYAYGIDALWLNILTVSLGQAAVCYALGVPMVKTLERMGMPELINQK
jgi:uncharacterized membrane protein